MSISLSQKTNNRFRGIYRWILGFFMTDEIFAVANQEGEEHKPVSIRYFTGLTVFPYFGWSMGTLLGALLGNVLPDRVMAALGIAIYGMFIAIVGPEVKKSLPIAITVAIAAALSCIFFYVPLFSNISSGITITVSSIVSAVITAIIFPITSPTLTDDAEE